MELNELDGVITTLFRCKACGVLVRNKERHVRRYHPNTKVYFEATRS